MATHRAAMLSHARYCASVLHQASTYYQRGMDGISRSFALFDDILPHLVLAQKQVEFSWHSDAEAASIVIDFAVVGIHILAVRQPARDRIHWLEAALAAAVQTDNPYAKECCIRSLSSAHREVGELQQAVGFAVQAVEISRAISYPSGEAAALTSRGVAYSDQGQSRLAIEDHNQALGLHRECGDRKGEAISLLNLGAAHLDLGQVDVAISNRRRFGIRPWAIPACTEAISKAS